MDPEEARRRREETEPSEGIGGGIVPPRERAYYDTPPDAGTEDSPTPATPAREPRPWIAIGLVLLAIFIALLVWMAVAGLH